jgi:predicted ABC-type ATPase
MLARLKELATTRQDFAFETTLASRSFAPWIRGLVEGGYAFRIMFLCLPSADYAVARVAERVRRGGHDVPDATVRRRYSAGLRNFFSLYRPIATTWHFFDSSPAAGPTLVAEGRGILASSIRDAVEWKTITDTWM